MNRAPSRGFTLLEVMLAFVLLATAMGLLVAMLSNGLHQVAQAKAQTEASLHAQSLIDQLGVLEAITPGQRRGEFDQGRYRYQLDISEVADPAPTPEPIVAGPAATTTFGAPKVYRIALAVRWGAEQAAQQLNFVTLRARTPPASAAPAP